MRIEIERRNGYAKLLSQDLEVASYLSDVVSFRTRDYQPWSRTYLVKQTTMVDSEGRFPAGLLPLLEQLCQMEGHELLVNDLRKRPPGEPDTSVWSLFPTDLSPFEFQEDAAKTAIEQTAGMIKADVGGGKSLIAAMIVAAVPCRWVILVHKENLVNDLSSLFSALGIEHATHTSKKRRVADVTIATYSSAKKPEHARALMSGAQGYILDECHTAAMQTAIDVLKHARDAYYRIGLSGTPIDRSDARSVVAAGYTGDIIYKIDTQELERLGRIVPADVRQVEFEHSVSTKVEFGAIYREMIVTNRRRNSVVAMMAILAQKPCIVFVTQKEHLELLLKLLKKNYSDPERIAYAWGETGMDERRDTVQLMRDGELDILVASTVFQEGVNIPNLRSVVLAAAGRSVIRTVQQLGRGTRVASGKDSFELWDVLDTGMEMFFRQAQVRGRNYRKRGYTPQVISLDQLEQMFTSATPGGSSRS